MQPPSREFLPAGFFMNRRAEVMLLGLVVCLQLAVIWRLAVGGSGQIQPQGNSPPTTESAPAMSLPQATASESLPNAEAAPFRWRVLESADYRTYVRNLRAIECPEQTIRDIITADVDADVYARRRETIRTQEQGLAAHPLSNSLRGEMVRRQEQELWNEECGLINELLAQEGSQQQVAIAGRVAGAPASPTPVMPLAFADSTTCPTEFTQEQHGTLEFFQRRFLMALDGLEPTSEEYAQQWLKAQRQQDATLRAVLGTQACQKLLREASRQQLASVPAGN
jgi:hypothetical protein